MQEHALEIVPQPLSIGHGRGQTVYVDLKVCQTRFEGEVVDGRYPTWVK